MADEYVVLLDESGAPVGRAPKDLVHDANTPLHLGFSCYVLDTDDRLLVTRRASTKKTFPDTWTNSFCGHPEPEESLVAAVRRRGLHELQLDVAQVVTVLPRFRYRAAMNGVVEHEICPVTSTRVEAGATVGPHSDEVSDWEWVPWQVFAREVADGSRAVSPWCREQVQELAQLGPTGSWTDASHDLPPALRGHIEAPDGRAGTPTASGSR